MNNTKAPKTVEEILKSDYKKYTAKDVNFSIGVVQSANEAQLEDIKKQVVPPLMESISNF